jgi:hypothetical protein
MLFFMRLLATGLLASMVASCGGGGGGGSGGGDACAKGDIVATFSYPVGLNGNVGAMLMATPQISGVPTSCTGSLNFAVASGTLPPGMALNASTGVISGVPTTSGVYMFQIRMTVDNFVGFLSGGINANINDAAGYSLTGWELMTDHAPFSDDFRIGYVGTKLYMVVRGFYSHIIETFESTDGGATWTNLAITGPTGDPKDFALASDGTHIFFSGGIDGAGTLSNQVWRFDGSSWTQMTAAAAFPARERHSMVSHGGALYVLGGRFGTTPLGDTWKSTDSGANWIQVSASGFNPRFDFCAVSDDAGFIYVIGGRHLEPPQPPGVSTSYKDVWRSADGASWTSLPQSPTSPFMEAVSTQSGSCASRAGRIFYMGDTVQLPGLSSTVSSADGTTWTFEPHTNALSGITPGAVTLGGRIYVSAGSGTSMRRVLRSTP